MGHANNNVVDPIGRLKAAELEIARLRERISRAMKSTEDPITKNDLRNVLDSSD